MITTNDGWTHPRKVPTRFGDRTLRALPLNKDHDAFKAWAHDKKAVKAARFAMGKAWRGSGFELCHWENVPGQFEVDIEALNAIIKEATHEEEHDPSVHAIDYVAEDFDPLVTRASSNLFSWQRPSCQRLVHALMNGNALDASQTGCHAKGTPILMFSGQRKNVEDIEEGDLVMGWNGTPRAVKRLHRGRQMMVRIQPKGGHMRPFDVNLDHILTLEARLDGREYLILSTPGSIIDVSVRDWIDWSSARKAQYRLFKRLPGDHLNSGQSEFKAYHLKTDDYYGFEITGDGRYLMGDFTVTHNSGKTFIALATCAELGLTPYVIAPLAVLEAWRRAATFMGVVLGGVSNYDKARAGSTPFIAKNPDADHKNGERTFAFQPIPPQSTLFNLAPPDILRPLLIFDEVQKTKSGAKTLQGQLLVDVVLQGAKVLCLSATAAKDPTEMHGIGIALNLHEGGKSYTEWMKRHGCKRGAGGYFFTDNVQEAQKIMQKIHRTIFPAKGTRIRSTDVPGYPENAVTAHLVENQSIVTAYEQMKNDLEDIEWRKKTQEIDNREAKAEGLAAITKARRASEYGKVEYMIEETKELLADGFQVAVFLNFREHLAMMRDALRLPYAPIWGTEWLGKEQRLNDYGKMQWFDIDGRQQKPEDRTALIDAFQSGKHKVVLVSLMAGGAGISLHDEHGIAPRQSLISPSYSAIDLVQGIGRIWRAGSKSKATQRIIYAAGTIEEEIAASVTSKIEHIETLNDGDLLADCLAHFTSIE